MALANTFVSFLTVYTSIAIMTSMVRTYPSADMPYNSSGYYEDNWSSDGIYDYESSMHRFTQPDEISGSHGTAYTCLIQKQLEHVCHHFGEESNCSACLYDVSCLSKLHDDSFATPATLQHADAKSCIHYKLVEGKETGHLGLRLSWGMPEAGNSVDKYGFQVDILGLAGQGLHCMEIIVTNWIGSNNKNISLPCMVFDHITFTEGSQYEVRISSIPMSVHKDLEALKVCMPDSIPDYYSIRPKIIAFENQTVEVTFFAISEVQENTDYRVYLYGRKESSNHTIWREKKIHMNESTSKVSFHCMEPGEYHAVVRISGYTTHDESTIRSHSTVTVKEHNPCADEHRCPDKSVCHRTENSCTSFECICQAGLRGDRCKSDPDTLHNNIGRISPTIAIVVGAIVTQATMVFLVK